jgi:hypothetical protein
MSARPPEVRRWPGAGAAAGASLWLALTAPALAQPVVERCPNVADECCPVVGSREGWALRSPEDRRWATGQYEACRERVRDRLRFAAETQAQQRRESEARALARRQQALRDEARRRDVLRDTRRQEELRRASLQGEARREQERREERRQDERRQDERRQDERRQEERRQEERRAERQREDRQREERQRRSSGH